MFNKFSIKPKQMNIFIADVLIITVVSSKTNLIVKTDKYE